MMPIGARTFEYLVLGLGLEHWPIISLRPSAVLARTGWANNQGFVVEKGDPLSSE